MSGEVAGRLGDALNEALARAEAAEKALRQRPAPEHWRDAIRGVLFMSAVYTDRVEADARRRAAEGA